MQADTATYYLKEFDRYTEDFASTCAGFDKQSFNTPIAEGKWSPGQYVQHMLKSERGILRLISGPAEAVEGRSADGLCPQIEEKMLHAPAREAPERLRPAADERFPLDATLDELMDVRADIRVAFEFADDIAGVVTAYEHPLFGTLTVLEWVYFTAMHGERHRRQLG